MTVANTVASGLVAAYGLNEGAGTPFADLSGGANNGSIFQATWYAGGRYGRALSFDGSNDVASIPDANTPRPLQPDDAQTDMNRPL